MANPLQDGATAISAGVTGVTDTIAQFMANLQNEARYQEARGLTREYGARNEELAFNRNNDLVFQGGDFRGYTEDFMRDASIASGQAYGDRTAAAMGFIENSGIQERRDINQQFDSAQGTVDANMAGRGLSGTTIMPTIRAGMQRQRSDALGSLQERLLQQRVNTYGQFSGDQLNAADTWRSNTYNANSGARRYQTDLAQQGYADLRNTIGNTQADTVNLIASRNDTYQPTPLSLYSAAGSSTVGPPSAPSGGLWGPAAGGAITGASTVAAATIIAAGACLGEDTMLECSPAPRGGGPPETKDLDAGSSGNIEMKKAKRGDKIRCPDGVFRAITWIGKCAAVHHEGDRRYRELRMTDGAMLRATTDHVIYESKTLGSFKPGDSMGPRVVSMVVEVKPFDGWDLLLEGGKRYMANGFDVLSMLAHEGRTPSEMADRQEEFDAMIAERIRIQEKARAAAGP